MVKVWLSADQFSVALPNRVIEQPAIFAVHSVPWGDFAESGCAETRLLSKQNGRGDRYYLRARLMKRRDQASHFVVLIELRDNDHPHRTLRQGNQMNIHRGRWNIEAATV